MLESLTKPLTKEDLESKISTAEKVNINKGNKSRSLKKTLDRLSRRW